MQPDTRGAGALLSGVRAGQRMTLGILLLCLTQGVAETAAQPRPYDPLQTAPGGRPAVQDLTVHDQGRSRDIPLRIYLPPADTPTPVVLFSHGLGGSRQGSAYLGLHWAARGYVAVYLQHPGSDVAVWADEPAEARMQAMHEAANARNFMLRVKDVPAVLDQLARWNSAEGHFLRGRLDLSRVGMSGHSFGAVTTQAVSGQRFAGGIAGFTDPRIAAAVALSPSSPRRGDPAAAFGRVAIPWMLMTGTDDLAPIGGATVESRLAVFRSLPPGRKYEVVLDGAEHSSFTDRSLPGDRRPRNPNHHRAIRALSTAFWDAYLRDESAAREWLDGAGPRTVLEPQDRWQRK